jgi:hypothetical protein
MALLPALGEVPVYPKLKIIVEMPSLDGEQMIGGGHTIDLDYLATQADISTNEARLNFTRGLLQRLGEMKLAEVVA